jgi:hypothetical protein
MLRRHSVFLQMELWGVYNLPKEERVRMFPRYWSLMTSQKGNDMSQQNQGGQQGGQQQNPGQQTQKPGQGGQQGGGGQQKPGQQDQNK